MFRCLPGVGKAILSSAFGRHRGQRGPAVTSRIKRCCPTSFCMCSETFSMSKDCMSPILMEANFLRTNSAHCSCFSHDNVGNTFRRQAERLRKQHRCHRRRTGARSGDVPPNSCISDGQLQNPRNLGRAVPNFFLPPLPNLPFLPLPLLPFSAPFGFQHGRG